MDGILAVHNSLGDLQNRVVYIGGATISLFADREAFEVRETDDVDVIVEISNYPEHAKFEEMLRSRGFTNDFESEIRCRYKVNGITVDIMPTKDISMDLKNYWYPEGFKCAMDFKINELTIIKILTAPYFIAAKLEAFNNRGQLDGRTSQDFEDIVYLFENRSTIWGEFRNSNEILKSYLVNEFKEKLANPAFNEWIDCHVEIRSAPDWILEELIQFINLK